MALFVSAGAVCGIRGDGGRPPLGRLQLRRLQQLGRLRRQLHRLPLLLAQERGGVRQAGEGATRIHILLSMPICFSPDYSELLFRHAFLTVNWSR
jgi:hypothetical protein